MPLPPACISLLHSLTDRRHVAAGEIILLEGRSGERMYLVSAGEAAVMLQGNEIDRLSAGDIFGEMALLDARPRSASVIAVTDVDLIPVTRSEFAGLVQKHPDLALQVMNIMSVRLRRSMEEEVKKQQMEHELALGHEIQLSLLPTKNPDIPGWEFATYYRAARQVGGDLYDFVPSAAEAHCLGLVIADVTGKGVPAAMFMAATRTMMRAETRSGHSPANILQNTNELLLQDGRTPLFLTAFYAALDTGTGRLRYASAGHEPAYLLRAEDNRLQALQARGMLLGAFSGVQLEEQSLTLEPGDVIVLYTDGLTEAKDAAGAYFEQERVEAVIAGAAGMGASDMVAALVTQVERFVGGEPQSDDLTIVAVRRTPLEDGSDVSVDREEIQALPLTGGLDSDRTAGQY